MMKKTLMWTMVLLIFTTFIACGKPQQEEADTANPTAAATEIVSEPTTAPTEIPTEAPTEAPAEDSSDSDEDFEYEGDANSYYIDKVYHDQIARYSAALSEQWDESKYFENNLSSLPTSYYEGNPLDNVGFGFVDFDNDGSMELIIGAIQGAKKNPVVFEIWTLVDKKPVMLAQSNSTDRYYLQFAEDDNMWSVANEVEKSASNTAVHYMMLIEGKFEVMQAIIFDSEANAKKPWFMAYDVDWDTSNDMKIDKKTAKDIIESNKNLYTSIEYFPYIYFK